MRNISGQVNKYDEDEQFVCYYSSFISIFIHHLCTRKQFLELLKKTSYCLTLGHAVVYRELSSTIVNYSEIFLEMFLL